MATNAYQLPVDNNAALAKAKDSSQPKPDRRLCLFPTASRINHSCAPNACVFVGAGVVLVFALTDIAAGTEICDCYDEQLLWMPTARRAGTCVVYVLCASLSTFLFSLCFFVLTLLCFGMWCAVMLSAGYGFKCACSRCVKSNPFDVWLTAQQTPAPAAAAASGSEAEPSDAKQPATATTAAKAKGMTKAETDQMQSSFTTLENSVMQMRRSVQTPPQLEALVSGLHSWHATYRSKLHVCHWRLFQVRYYLAQAYERLEEVTVPSLSAKQKEAWAAITQEQATCCDGRIIPDLHHFKQVCVCCV